MRIDIKPLSVNAVWRGKRFKTPAYTAYEAHCALLLPRTIDCPLDGKLHVQLTFGLSSKNADIDNPVKPILDILQKKYDFDDKQIYKLDLEKIDVKKGEEFIEIVIHKYQE